jgi:hypothetical protein
MTNMRRIHRIAAVGAAAAATAFAATPFAAAAPPPPDGPFHSQNWARTPGNAAGVVFRPYGDDFEIWDNVADGKAVTVWYKEQFSSRWQKIVSRVHVGTYRRNLPERPHYVTFAIEGHDRQGRLVSSKGSIYRTWGT